MAENRKRGSLAPEGTPKRKKLRLSTAPQASVPQEMAAQMLTFRLVGSPRRKCFEPRRQGVMAANLVRPESSGSIGTGKVIAEFILICIND